MSVEKRRILVIENQQTQFSKIIEGLSSFSVYPKPSQYINFIDNIRIWVNERYFTTYRNNAFAYIQNYIKEQGIELILMDHILGGAHHCLDGISLATEINDLLSKDEQDNLPIIFLSKTEHTKKTKVIDFEKYEHKYPNSTKWIHKGYFGEELLEPNYFREHVVEQINDCLEKSDEALFWERFDKVLELTFPDNQEIKRRKLLDIRKNKKFTELSAELIRSIMVFWNSKSFSDLNV